MKSNDDVEVEVRLVCSHCESVVRQDKEKISHGLFMKLVKSHPETHWTVSDFDGWKNKQKKTPITYHKVTYQRKCRAC